MDIPTTVEYMLEIIEQTTPDLSSALIISSSLFSASAPHAEV